MDVSSLSSSFSKVSEEQAKSIISAGQALKQASNAENLQANENASGEKGGLGAISATEEAQSLVKEDGKGSIIDLLG